MICFFTHLFIFISIIITEKHELFLKQVDSMLSSVLKLTFSGSILSFYIS